MARERIACRIGSALCLVWATSSAVARADAESESPFAFDPPAGWVREVRQDGRVNYLDSENPGNCLIQILPVIPEDLSAATASWLRQFFDAELRKHMRSFEEAGVAVLYDIEPPSFMQIVPGTYIIYKHLTIPVEDRATTMLHYQLMMLFKNGHSQRLFSIVDSFSCRSGIISAQNFFISAANALRDAPTDAAPKRSRGEWAAQSTELVGEWTVASSGFSAFVYAFGADGIYEHSGTMESSLANTKVVLFESGTYSVQGDILVLKRSSGTLVQNAQKEQLGPQTETYRWRISVDRYTGGRVLWLIDSNGQEQQFYASN